MSLRHAAFVFGMASMVAWSAAGQSRSEKPLDAQALLGLVQAFYEQTRSLEADFEQVRYTRLYDRDDRARGKVAFKKPGKMRWDYAKPNGQVFVTSGDNLLIYQPPETGEKHGQLIERAIDEDQLPSAFSFLTGRGDLSADFDARLLESAPETFKDGYVLQLIPRKPTPNYEQLVFFVRVLETKGKRGAVVQRVLIIDASGNRNRFDFKNIKFNRKLADARFEYEPPAGTHRVKP